MPEKNTCGACKHGHDSKPGRERPSPGTVWCVQRDIQMARNRQMACFVQLHVEKTKRCVECKKAKMLKPSGETPQLGNIWCEKKHAEMNKLRGMECFE